MNPIRRQIGSMRVYEWALIQAILCGTSLLFVNEEPTATRKRIALSILALSSAAFVTHVGHRIKVNKKKMDDEMNIHSEKNKKYPPGAEIPVNPGVGERALIGITSALAVGVVTYYTMDSIANTPIKKLPKKPEVIEPTAPVEKTPAQEKITPTR